MQITTARLVLRPFRLGDRRANAEIFADSDVRRFSLGILGAQAANERVERSISEYKRLGYGMLAVEDKRDGTFIGTLGLTGLGPSLRDAIPSRPELQIAWQLAKRVWGKGLATEGAQAVLEYAFHVLRKPDVVAITAQINMPSRRVMEKIGMVHQPTEDFLHPEMPSGHRLRPHVLYRVARC
ncbi:GNAT family N-acetyltransferase [Devosia sp. 1635]|uniref:GNAT family N-acetyltransferase n=1 Tax=Devosia sp. 1635 TaxID=2726066 RepID=UPI0015669DCC|nr:GNAT family N-acetyltransferase [Devosia sp. 1635]